MKRTTKIRMIYGILATMIIAPSIGFIVPAALNASKPKEDKKRIYVAPPDFNIVGNMAVKVENGKVVKKPAIPVDLRLVNGKYVPIPNSEGYVYDFDTNTFVSVAETLNAGSPKTLVKQQ